MGFDTNSVVIVGRLTKDPELSYTPSTNKAICKFSIASNSGTKDEDVSYFDIVVWEKQAENCNKFILKGTQVIITGRLKQDRYQTQDGQNRSRVNITATSVQFTGTGNREGNNNVSNDFNNNKNNADPMQDPFDVPEENSVDNNDIPF